MRDEADAVSGTNAVSKVLTRDNTLLSRPTMDNEDATNSDVVIAQEIATAVRAVTCKSEPSDTVRAYVEVGPMMRTTLLPNVALRDGHLEGLRLSA